MKKLKNSKIQILLILFALVISLVGNTVFADDFEGNISEIQKEKYIFNNIISHSKDEKVRVFVELKKTPLIFHAEAKEQLLTVDERSTLRTKRKEIENYQQSFKGKVKNQFQDVEFLDSYDILVNGFSCIMTNETAESLKYNYMVKDIYILNEIDRPSEEFSNLNIDNLIETTDSMENSDGSGSLISIIDTGFDPYHEAMIISDGVEVKLTEEDVLKNINEDNLSGKYYSKKFPYGYNYFDKNTEIRDLGYKSEHGMHVAGIAAANGKVVGQAPEAQILAMKVFSNNPSFPYTYEDIYIKAIEDSIKLGADVINLSLGTPAGFNMEDSLLSRVIKTATDNGIICCTSAGNAGQFLFGKGYPYWHDPDIGTIGSLSVVPDTLSVGACYIDEGTGEVRMADFSSWGTGPKLELKPEIVAPGVDIESTLQYNKYGIMSGTSMASPYVAGNMAKLRQYIESMNFVPNKDVKEIGNLTKIAAMNTASIVYDENNQPYSPRVQGAGLINIDNGLKFTTCIVERNSGLSKVELRDFTDTNFSIPLQITNYSTQNMTYSTKVFVFNNVVKEEDMETSYNLLKLQPLEGVVVEGPSEVEVDGSTTVDVDFHVDFSNVMDEYGEPIGLNQFIEGFIVFTPLEGDFPEISIPYCGFYGDWNGEDSPRIFDGMRKFDEKSVFGFAGFVDNNSEYVGYVPGYGYYKSKDRIAISPGTDSEIQSLVPILSYLRNVEEVQFNIIDKDGRFLKRLASDKYIRKNYFYRGNNNTSRVNEYSRWDGKINLKIVPDGVYYYQIKGRLHGSSHWQEKVYPVIVDTKAPEIETLRHENGKITWSASDFGSGLSHFYIYVDGVNALGKNNVYSAWGKAEGEFEQEYIGDINNNIKIMAVDCAGNKTEKSLSVVEDKTPPQVYITSPQMFDIFSSNEVLVEGYVLEESQLKNLIIDGEFVDFNYNYSKRRYEFSHLLDIEKDGVQNITISAEDEWGNCIEYIITFYVYTEEPVLEVEDSVLFKYMPKGGRTVVIDNVAYEIEYFKTLSNVDELLNSDDIYVKLYNEIFIDKSGRCVSNIDIPQVEYYYSDNMKIIYGAEDGKIQSIHTTIETGDNSGIFTVYVNGSEYYAYDEGKITDLEPIYMKLDLEIHIYDDIDEIVIEIVDMAGNTKTETIRIRMEE